MANAGNTGTLVLLNSQSCCTLYPVGHVRVQVLPLRCVPSVPRFRTNCILPTAFSCTNTRIVLGYPYARSFTPLPPLSPLALLAQCTPAPARPASLAATTQSTPPARCPRRCRCPSSRTSCGWGAGAGCGQGRSGATCTTPPGDSLPWEGHKCLPRGSAFVQHGLGWVQLTWQGGTVALSQHHEF